MAEAAVGSLGRGRCWKLLVIADHLFSTYTGDVVLPLLLPPLLLRPQLIEASQAAESAARDTAAAEARAAAAARVQERVVGAESALASVQQVGMVQAGVGVGKGWCGEGMVW